MDPVRRSHVRLADNVRWFPKRTDMAWCAKIREEHEDEVDSSDEEIREHYANGRKYATGTAWDAEAYKDFESLADAHLGLLKKVEEWYDEIFYCGYHPGLTERMGKLLKEVGIDP